MPEEQQEKLANCIHCIDEMPPTGLKEKIPEKDYWVSKMLEMLPKEHPLRTIINHIMESQTEEASEFDTGEMMSQERLGSATNPSFIVPRQSTDDWNKLDDQLGYRVHKLYFGKSHPNPVELVIQH